MRIAAALVAWMCGGAATAWGQPLDSTGSTSPAPKVEIPREGCVTAACHPGIKAKAELHGPVRVNACDGCHQLSDAATHTFKALRERRELCALCHAPDPLTNEHVHPPVAQGECLSCHDPHGSTVPQMLRGERYADACANCHRDVTGAHDRVHGPASVGACGACHQPHSSKLPKLLIADGRDLCLRCHVRVAIELRVKPVVHAPVLGECRVCHDPHATDNPALLVADTVTLCSSCHEDVAHTAKNAVTQHGAVTSNRGCTNCHTPHAGDFASLLKQDPKTLCFECHDKPIALPDGTKLTNMKKLIEAGKSLHGAVTQKGCIECHEIHGGGHRRLLTNEYPSELYYPFSESSYALCFSCHDKQLAMEAKGKATGFRNGETNLHFVHVNKDKKGRSCKVCHDAHAASADQHIRDTVAFGPGGWKMPINYRSLPEGGKCGGACHQPLEYNRVTPLVYPARAGNGEWRGEELVPGRLAEPETPVPANPPK
ncbi:MAG: cytochrome c3 family protein [Phycisphaerales bacterium]